MGEIHQPQKAMLVLAAFSRHREALQWSFDQCSQRFGEILFLSDYIPFDKTQYYTPSMGSGLEYQMAAFKTLMTQDSITDIKRTTNDLEQIYARENNHPEERPLNLDPGYLTALKFALATTKDAWHRVYVKDGIYVESTLKYRSGKWEPWPWTYANYQDEPYKDFLLKCRGAYLEMLKETKDY